MEASGLSHVRAEPVTVPHWERGAAQGALVSPYRHELALAALGGSVGTPPSGVEGDVDPTVNTPPARATGIGLSSSASAMLKTAVFAPMPIASDSTATSVKPGLLASMRQP